MTFPSPPAPGHLASAHRLDVVSDTICPWCYVGKRRLEAALARLATEGLRFEINWRPFQLNPTMPMEGLDRREYRSAKFGSWERSQALDAQVAMAGAGDGLALNHGLMARTPNTLRSHILIRIARETGGGAMQDRVVEGLFAAYFTDGRDVGDPAVLVDIGEKGGLDPDAVAVRLADPADARAVRDDEGLARDLGLRGVPSVVFEGRALFSGAQPPHGIIAMLREAAGPHRSRRSDTASARGTPHALA